MLLSYRPGDWNALHRDLYGELVFENAFPLKKDFKEAIAERKPNLPVLLVTGYSQAVAEAGPDFTIMRKPFQLADLSRAVTRMIAEAKQPANSNIVRLRKTRPRTGSGTEEK